MNLLGNIVWLLLGGLAVAVEYFVSGLALCLTIVGIPFGIQALKLGLLALLPFGQTSVRTDQGTGCLYTLMNVIWFFLGGIWIVLTHLLFGSAAIHHDCRHTVRQTAFQADEHGSHAVRAQHCPDRRAVTKRLENPHTL